MFRISSGYGDRIDPITFDVKKHTGIDLVTDTPNAYVPSFITGQVIYADYGETGSGYGGYGNTVAIKDEKGFTHLFSHLSSIFVNVGDKISKGIFIGQTGNSGRSTGEHLHYEVRSGEANTDVDPTEYLPTNYVSNVKKLDTRPSIVSNVSANQNESIELTLTQNVVRWSLLLLLVIGLFVIGLKLFEGGVRVG